MVAFDLSLLIDERLTVSLKARTYDKFDVTMREIELRGDDLHLHVVDKPRGNRTLGIYYRFNLDESVRCYTLDGFDWDIPEGSMCAMRMRILML